LEIKIYQIYFREEQINFLLSGFIPYFNQSSNSRQLYETEVFLDLFSDESKLQKESYYGAVSWKFGKKANLFPNDIFEFINDNPENELYLVNPYPELPHLYENPWIQGENVHPGLLKISQSVFDKSHYKIDLRSLILKPEKQVYCNYFIASGLFWKKYISFLQEIILIIETDSNIQKVIKKKTSHHYKASFFPFFLERLLPTYLYLNSHIKTASYQYDKDFLIERYLNKIKEMEIPLMRHQKIFRHIPFKKVLRKFIQF